MKNTIEVSKQSKHDSQKTVLGAMDNEHMKWFFIKSFYEVSAITYKRYIFSGKPILLGPLVSLFFHALTAVGMLSYQDIFVLAVVLLTALLK